MNPPRRSRSHPRHPAQNACNESGPSRFNRSTQRKQRAKNLRSLSSLLLNSGRDGDADFKFLARDTSPTYVDNRPLLVAGKPELREYKTVFVGGDVEVSQFSDEITVNCAPLV